MTKPENELLVIARENDLDETRVTSLLADFGDPFKKAQALVKEAAGIAVDSEDQKDLMAQARSKRLALKEVRVDAEKTRKRIKEQSLREGKAIDGMANIIKAMIVPAEEWLEKQEKFAENLEIERRRARIQERSARLIQYLDESSLQAYNYADLSDEAFDDLLSNIKAAYDKKIADRKAAADMERAEAERLEKERQAREEEERKRRIAAEKKAKIERDKRKKAEDEAAEKQRIADAKLAEEREAREKLEREKRERDEADRLEKQRLEDEAAEKAETEKRAARAPDRVKLLKVVGDLAVEIEVELSTVEARAILARINAHRASAIEVYKSEINKL